MAPGSDFGSWGVESLETHAERRGHPTRSVERSPVAQRRPVSATVRVPYLPSHVRISRLRPKRRPRSAASYMRSTFAIDSALPARATTSTTQQQQQPRGRRLHGRASWLPEARPEDAKYVLQEDARQGRNGSFDVSTVPRPRQGFGVRMPTAGNERVVTSGGREGGRCHSRRPASAPVRFFGRRPASSPGCEQTGGPELYDRHGGVPRRQATKRRMGSALTGNPAHHNQAHDIQRYHLHDQRKDGSPLPPAAWGVRPTSASSTLAVPLVAGCLEQTGRTYEEVVVCRGTRGVVKGSVARHRKRQPNRSLAGPDDQRQQNEGFAGRGSKGLGLLEGATEGLWACGGQNEGSGDDAGDENQLGLAINPSPWGAFVGGPPAEKTTGGRSRKRPSSAPRRPSMTTVPAPGFEAGSARVQARPRSAHAASPSRSCATEVFVTMGYSSCDEEDGSGPKAAGADRAMQIPARRSFSGRPVSAGEIVGREGTKRMDAGRPRKADGARLSKSSCQQRARASSPEADLVVVARQVQGCTQKSGLACKAGERVAVPNCWPNTSLTRGAPSATLSPPSHVQPTPPAPPLPPPPRPPPPTEASTQKVLGLFGSALLPAGNGTKVPRSWKNKRSVMQPRKQGQPQPQRRQQRAMTSEVRTTKSCAETNTDGRYASLNFAPVVLDRRIIGGGEQNDRRHVRAAGLVGKALRVPKHANIQSQQQQAATSSAVKREGKRLFYGLSQGPQSWLSGAQ